MFRNKKRKIQPDKASHSGIKAWALLKQIRRSLEDNFDLYRVPQGKIHERKGMQL